MFRYTDQEAYRVFSSAFPDRKVVQIDVEAVNYGGGGMNCISQQQPKWFQNLQFVHKTVFVEEIWETITLNIFN